MKGFWQEKYGLLLTGALIIAYSVFFSALSIQRHNTFRTAAADLGQMDQALWNTLRGHLLEDTRPDIGSPTSHQAPRLTDHVEPIFVLVSLAYVLYDRVEAILILQSIVIALGALPLYWIARRRLESELAAAVFAAIYLLFPALEAANLAEFHAVTLAPLPLLLAYHYATERAWKRYAVFSLVALAVKEDIALLVLVMALWAAGRDLVSASGFQWRRPKTWSLKRVNAVPAVIAVVSIAWFALALAVIIPHFSPGGESVYIGGRYPEISRNPVQMAAAIPSFLSKAFAPDKIAYLVKLLASVGLIAILDPVALLLGSPALILNLLSSYEAMYSGTYHYSAPVAPYFVLAAIGGAGTLSGWLSRRFALKHALAFVVAPVLAIALGYHMLAGYTPVGGAYFWPELTPHQQELARFVDQIPPDVPISTTSTLFPHLSHRRFAYRFPTIQDAEYILLDVSQAAKYNSVEYWVSYLDALKQGFGIRDALDGYILLERGNPRKELPDGFYNFLRACHCAPPQYPVRVDFDNRIRFIGYDVRQDDWQRVYLRTYWSRLPGFDNQNYALFPFFVDDNGSPREDVRLPDLLSLFWYPTLKWQPDEVVVVDTAPMDVGPRARIGVGVYFGADWETAEKRIAPQSDAPIFGDWVLIGELVRRGNTYEVVR